ncbi:hypothetical protein DL766_008330 [Monosporascus sp. MC13-8B]|uniref:Lytic polysaccharide monooxygenase n=1 Tax=Monosporascus cannonballus TaxID=155416 RepID=A0ABY0GX71_9PEZI|nr:hypothetical protein DL762_008296 [Monosporascus cannonballus]RYP19895.1 hypothetical protein DL766_008330 [Monosporascus sp. MC13-8B]
MQFTLSLIAALTTAVAGHIHMINPPPIRAKENPNSGWDTIDYDINSPLPPTMDQFPCKGVLKYLGQPQGASVATYSQGSSQAITIGTGAAHNGGSCQISLSYDQGKSFKVIKSYIGNCPVQNGDFPFTVPADAPTGEAVLSWSWINQVGNREFYHNCAVVTVTGASAKAKRQVQEVSKRQGVPFNSLPEIFVAHMGNGWCVAEGVDVVYPEPGPDVTNTSSRPGEPFRC